jgi:hypothetical protein
MRMFHPTGINRDIGFQAVTNTPTLAPWRESSASIAAERRPIRTVTPSAEYRVAR